ncbi:glycoside hydrolase family 25 protein [Flavobacterium sp. MFBS3-15]|uniref:glycoside hydrolase family 25 protein n=1 Tax=Flavobacterium sp. MFBS3-15 TaxID=2989816 RepID=UPI002236069D|nr:glycoside hydrolase family 25 protein [Flavobacterium sp. MFBS3-15]MCW4469594.1 glycoside hydrolase family 25 protein [Flavobacterium sp. MFBS3-15]
MKRVPPKTAVRRAKPKTRETAKLSQGKLLRYPFLLLLLAFVAVAVYQYRHGILYWLGFKVNSRIESLTKEERKIENLRIYEILGRHKDKVFGLDVSHYQGRIVWDSLKKDNAEFPMQFVFIRATAGKDGVDTEFTRNWKGAARAGLVRGAYHYYRPDENSLKQAESFIKRVKLGKGDLPPVLDIEKIPAGQSMDSLKSGLKKWLGKVEGHYGMKPILYSGERFYADFLKDEFQDYTLWIANYSFFADEIKKEWLFWQFTDKGSVGGIEGDVDVNIFNGNREIWETYLQNLGK